MRRTDGFGIEHRSDCQAPEWGTSVLRVGVSARVHVQRCRSCGVTWRPGEPAGHARPVYGYPGRRR